MAGVEAGFLLGPDDERGDGFAGGFGEESGAAGGPVDVGLLDGDADLSEEVVRRAVGGEDEVGEVEFVRVRRVYEAADLGLVQEGGESRQVAVGWRRRWP